MTKNTSLVLKIVGAVLVLITIVAFWRACRTVPPPETVAVYDKEFVPETTVPVFKDEPAVVEKVRLRTRPQPVAKEAMKEIVGKISYRGDTTTDPPPDDAGHTNLAQFQFRVTFDGDKVFVQDGNKIRYGWTGNGSCEIQLEEGGSWMTLGKSPLDLTASSTIGVPAVSTPTTSALRNRFTLGLGAGTNGMAGSAAYSRSLVWKKKFTVAIMPDEIGVQAVVSGPDALVLATSSWRF